MLADAGGAEGDVCAGVAVAGAGGAGVEVLELAVGDEGAEVVGAGGCVGHGAGGKKCVDEVVFGFGHVAFGVLETFEYEVGDAAWGGRRGDSLGLGLGPVSSVPVTGVVSLAAPLMQSCGFRKNASMT